MKKKMISNSIKAAFLSACLILAASCDLQDHLQDPSHLTPTQAGNEFIFNGLQLNFAGFFLTATQFGMDNTRMLAMGGAAYENAYVPNNFDGLWYNAYSDFLVNANLLLSKTTEDAATSALEYNAFYQGSTKVMKAYILMTLVDFFGDVPYSKALNPDDYFPTVDAGSSVYADAMKLLDDAIIDLNAVNSSTVKPGQDQYYGGDPLKWRKLANTLKMKGFLATRLVDVPGATAGIAALIAANDMISSATQDFVFKATANSVSNPNTYHPWFFGSYQTSAGQYMSNSYMNELYQAKLSPIAPFAPVRDPRIRFYFYRQTNTPTTDVNNLTCSSATSPPTHYPPGTAYCQLPQGYWGRDHLNNEGTPPDGLLRTIYGLYPAGGQFDSSQGVGVDQLVPNYLKAGAGGTGILPIMMSSFVKFMRAEYELMLNGSAANARVQLDLAARESIARVITFKPAFTPTSGAILNTFNLAAINNYMAAMLANYDAAVPIAPNTTVQQNQLDVIIKEYWVALWGNGIESYNMVRRTGKPANLQPALAPSPGEFYRSFTYPAVYIVRNNNATQKPGNTVQVFWDNNPAGFVK